MQLTATPRVVRVAWVATLLLGICVVFAVAVLGGHHFLSDDVFFYLRIADSIARGEGSSFNGVIPTNGYHPLWEGVCVVTRWVVGDRNHTFLRAHLAVSGCVTMLVTLVLARFPRSTRVYLPIAALLTTLYVLRSAMGSEQHLSLLLLALVLWRYRQPEERGGRDWVWGAWLGLALLARLDNVFALAGLFCSYVLRDAGERSRRLLVTGVAVSLVLAPYFAWNLLQFGHLQPISGAVKSGLAASMPLRVAKLGAVGSALCVLSFVLVALLVYLKDWQRRDTLLWFGAGACVHALYVFVRIDAVWSWYFSTELLFVAVTLGDLFDRWSSSELRARFATTPFALFALAMLALCASNAYKHLRADTRSPWYLDAGQWLSANLPADAVIATACTPGTLGYFTRQAVIAFDGLTGDYALQESFASKGLVPTLEALGVTHIISFGPQGSQLDRYVRETERIGHGGAGGAFYAHAGRATAVGLFSPFAGKLVGRYELRDEDLVGQGFCFLDLAVWRFAPQR